MDMKTFFVIRHGQKVIRNKESFRQNYSAPLTAMGVKQTKLLAHYFQKRDIKFTCVYCSPQLRARQTASILARELNLRVRIEPLLKERIVSRLRTHNKFSKWWELSRMNWSFVPPKGESVRMAVNRFFKSLERISEKDEVSSYLIVSHGRLIQLSVAARFKELRQRLDPKKFSLAETAVTVLSRRDGKYKLKSFNTTKHLAKIGSVTSPAVRD